MKGRNKEKNGVRYREPVQQVKSGKKPQWTVGICSTFCPEAPISTGWRLADATEVWKGPIFRSVIPERRYLPKPPSRRRRHRSRRSFTLPCGAYELWREVTSCARSFCLWACLSNHPWLRYRARCETEWISVLGFWRAPLSFPGGLLPGCGFLLLFSVLSLPGLESTV